MRDEMEAYRRRIEHHLVRRRGSKNDRRKWDYSPPEFWDFGTVLNVSVLVLVYTVLWYLTFVK